MFKFYACALFMLLGVHLQAVVVVNELEGDITLHGFLVYLETDCLGAADYKIYNKAHQLCCNDGEYNLTAGGSVEIMGVETFYLTVPGTVCGRAIYPVDSNSLIRVLQDRNKIKVIHENRACDREKKKGD